MFYLILARSFLTFVRNSLIVRGKKVSSVGFGFIFFTIILSKLLMLQLHVLDYMYD